MRSSRSNDLKHSFDDHLEGPKKTNQANAVRRKAVMQITK
jgi:hypothetical protein